MFDLKRRFHTTEDARPRGSDAPSEPEPGKRLRKQYEEWLPGVGGKVGGKEWCRQAKDVDMTDEEFCIMAALACKSGQVSAQAKSGQVFHLHVSPFSFPLGDLLPPSSPFPFPLPSRPPSSTFVPFPLSPSL